MNNNKALDLKSLINNAGDKKKKDEMIQLMNDIDFVIRKSESPTAMVVGVLHSLADGYNRHAQNVTIIKPNNAKDGEKSKFEK